MTATPTTLRPTRPTTIDEVLVRYPRLTAHLMCESLEYFSPLSAARAILDHIRQTTNACEWYLDMARYGNSLIQINRDTIGRAFKSRRFHKGYMAHYPDARKLVEMHRSRA